MAITGVSTSLPQLAALRPPTQPAPVAPDAGPGFAARLGQAIETVNSQQTRASDAVRDFETGQRQDLAGVMVEQQVASLGFQMTLQVRNKALQAYRDIMNMPV